MSRRMPNWKFSERRREKDNDLIRQPPWHVMSSKERKDALAQPAGKLAWSPELNRMILVPEKPE